MKRVLAFTPLLALALLAALFVGYSLKRDPHIQPAALVGRVARDLGFENLVFDVNEAAAILSALGYPPPRVA